MALVAGLTVAVLGLRYAGTGSAGAVDTWARSWVQALVPRSGSVALTIDGFGDPRATAAMCALLAAACLVSRRHRLAVVAVAGPALTGVVTTVLKPLTGRTIHDGSLSFPSGHTAAVTAVALVSALLLAHLLRAGRRLGMLLLVLGAGAAGTAMALAQVALDAHYPTDTVGGFGAAVAVVPAVAWLVDRLGQASRNAVRHDGDPPGE